MTQDELKAAVGLAALQYVKALPAGCLIGVGTGSTVNHFIDALASLKGHVRGAVPSSVHSEKRLRERGIAVLQAGEVARLPLYVDGADELNPKGHMIKGGGAALTREKIVADLADQFVCIVDESKCVPVLGRFPLPVEVIALAAPQIGRRLEAWGGQVRLREGVLTDNGNPILDVSGLSIVDPLAMESQINQWPGVVTVGIFASHKASLALVGQADGVKLLRF